jgi:hypothetical protein
MSGGAEVMEEYASPELNSNDKRSARPTSTWSRSDHGQVDAPAAAYETATGLI